MADYRDWACKVGLGHAMHQPSRADLCGPELRTLSLTFPNKVIGFLSFPEAVMPAEVSKRILGKSNKYRQRPTTVFYSRADCSRRRVTNIPGRRRLRSLLLSSCHGQ